MQRHAGILVMAIATVVLTLGAGQARAASLTTTYAGGNGNAGVAFDVDVAPVNGVEVTSLDVNLSGVAAQNGPVHIWTRRGTVTDALGSTAGWVDRGEFPVTTAGTGNPTPVPAAFPLAQGRNGIFIGVSFDSAGIEYTNGTTDTQDPALAIRARVGANAAAPGPATLAFADRVFNGTLHYEIRGPAISGPSGATSFTTPQFTYGTSPALTYECRLHLFAQPGPAFESCPADGYTPPLALGDGAYRFEVRSTDAKPTTSLVATREFTVDTRAPVASVTTGPAGVTAARQPTFGFSADETGVTYACRFVAQGGAPGFHACPATGDAPAAPLADGVYRFEVQATDAAGNTGPAAVRDFVVAANPAAAVATTPSADPATARALAACRTGVAALRTARRAATTAQRRLTSALAAERKARRSRNARKLRTAKRRSAAAQRAMKSATKKVTTAEDDVERACR
jgi:hypothetical protein